MKLTDKRNPEFFKIPTNFIYDNLNEYFIQIVPPLLPIDSSKISFKEGNFFYELSEKEKEFYTKDYINLSPHFDILNSELLKSNLNISDFPKEKFGKYEQDLMEIAFTKEDYRVNILTGEVGWGKSTLLRYCFFYLMNFTKSPNKIIPLYFDFNNFLSDLNNLIESQIPSYIKKNILLKPLKKFFFDYLVVDNEEFWNYAKEQDGLVDYKFRIDKIQKTQSNNQKKKIYRLRDKILEESDEIIFYCLKYLTKEKGYTPIFILDNVDPLKGEVCSELIKLFHKICQEYFVKAIIPMRPTTLHEMRNKRFQLFEALANVDVELELPDPTMILQNNLSRLLEYIKYDKKNLRLGNYIIKTSEIILLIETMFELVSNDNVKEFLHNISKGNLEEWGSILRTCFMSGLINEHKIIGNYVTKSFENISFEQYSSYNPEWIVYSSIITGNYKTYFPRSIASTAKDRICNVFCNKGGSINQQLIRLHILSFVDKKVSTNVKAIKSYYNEVFVNKPNDLSERLNSSINYAIRIMVNCGLIKSNQHYKIDENNWVDSIQDIIINKDCGKYYLNNLIGKFEYLMYMKDDVDLPDDVVNTMKDCIDSRGFFHQYGYLYNFLSFLFQVEIDLLNKMTSQQLEKYYAHFAPSGNKLFFTTDIVNGLISFGKYRSSSINKEDLKKITRLKNDMTRNNSKLLNKIKF